MRGFLRTRNYELELEMTDTSLGDEAIVTFLQALAITAWRLDDVSPVERNRANFIRVFDGYLNDLVKQGERDGSKDIRKNVNYLRDALEKALQSMSLIDAGGSKH